MFCKNCGTQLPDDSKFCTNCGYSFENDTPPKGQSKPFINPEELNSLKGFLASIFKSPIMCCSEYANKLSLKFSSIYFAVTTVLISLICALSLKGFVKTFLISTMKSVSKAQGYSLTASDLSEASFYFDSFLSDAIPVFKTFLAFILSIVIFFGIIILINYLVHNYLFKTEVTLNKYLVVASVGLTLESAALIISMIVFLVLPFLGLLLFSIASIVITVVLYSGLSNLKEEKMSDPYIFAIIYTIASSVTCYIITIIVIVHFTGLITGYTSNLFR